MSMFDANTLSISPDLRCWRSDQSSMSEMSEWARCTAITGPSAITSRCRSVMMVAISKMTCRSPSPVISRSTHTRWPGFGLLSDIRLRVTTMPDQIWRTLAESRSFAYT